MPREKAPNDFFNCWVWILKLKNPCKSGWDWHTQHQYYGMNKQNERGAGHWRYIYFLYCLHQQSENVGCLVTSMQIISLSSGPATCTSRIFSYYLFCFGFDISVELELSIDNYLLQHFFQTWFNTEEHFEKIKWEQGCLDLNWGEVLEHPHSHIHSTFSLTFPCLLIPPFPETETLLSGRETQSPVRNSLILMEDHLLQMRKLRSRNLEEIP